MKAQFLMDMMDTTKDIGKGMLSIYKKYDRIKLVGYLQPQFQVAQEKGAKSFIGGDFDANVNNRFMIRRGRLRIDYMHFSEDKGPSVQFALQFDGTERGVRARDFWGRVSENKYELFALTAGLFARPYSYEVNLSSSDRESPERGRMSQILTKSERDVGAMLSFEPRKKDHPFQYVKIDAGVFNGPGISAVGDYDSHKDFVTRWAIKSYPVAEKVSLSVAASYLNGGFMQGSKFVYKTKTVGSEKLYVVDSSITNIGKIAPRKYYGMDAQVKFKHPTAQTEFRVEWALGTQTATATTSETPILLAKENEGHYVRKFNGGYFYALQNIASKHQLVVKYDSYDPNTNVSGKEIGKPGSNFNVADIEFTTLGLGYIYYATENLKLVLWYDKVMNEKTALPGYTDDAKDDVFTCRLQFRF